MTKRLSWGPETDWNNQTLRQIGSLPLQMRTTGDQITGLRHRRCAGWSLVTGDLTKLDPGTLIYLSGPMTGHPDHNVPMFDEYAHNLRDQGFRVISPPELARQLGITPENPEANDRYEQILVYDLQAVDRAQVLLLLGPCPWTSRGVRLELRRAHMRRCPVLHSL